MVWRSLVGGFDYLNYFSIYWECHHPNWLIFCRGVGLKPPTSSWVIIRLSNGKWAMANAPEVNPIHGDKNYFRCLSLCCRSGMLPSCLVVPINILGKQESDRIKDSLSKRDKACKGDSATAQSASFWEQFWLCFRGLLSLRIGAFDSF